MISDDSQNHLSGNDGGRVIDSYDLMDSAHDGPRNYNYSPQLAAHRALIDKPLRLRICFA